MQHTIFKPLLLLHITQQQNTLDALFLCKDKHSTSFFVGLGGEGFYKFHGDQPDEMDQTTKTQSIFILRFGI